MCLENARGTLIRIRYVKARRAWAAGASARLADEPEGAARDVLHFPSESVDFPPQAVGLAEISPLPRGLTCLAERQRIGLDT
jgi:hypothetical protein